MLNKQCDRYSRPNSYEAQDEVRAFQGVTRGYAGMYRTREFSSNLLSKRFFAQPASPLSVPMFSHSHNTLSNVPGTYFAPMVTATGTRDLQMHGAIN